MRADLAGAFPLVIPDKGNRGVETGEGFRFGFALAIGFRHFRAEGGDPCALPVQLCGDSHNVIYCAVLRWVFKVGFAFCFGLVPPSCQLVERRRFLLGYIDPTRRTAIGCF